MNPEQWLSLKWNGGSTMSDRWLNQSKIIHQAIHGFTMILFHIFDNTLASYQDLISVLLNDQIVQLHFSVIVN